MTKLDGETEALRNVTEKRVERGELVAAETRRKLQERHSETIFESRHALAKLAEQRRTARAMGNALVELRAEAKIFGRHFAPCLKSLVVGDSVKSRVELDGVELARVKSQEFLARSFTRIERADPSGMRPDRGAHVNFRSARIGAAQRIFRIILGKAEIESIEVSCGRGVWDLAEIHEPSYSGNRSKDHHESRHGRLPIRFS